MAKTETAVNVNSISRISYGTVFNGEIMSPGDMRIDGTFNGKVQSKGRVVVGESAVIKGDIVCNDIDLWGKVEGNLYVKDTLALKEGCAVNGNLHVRRLSVELGATFNGTARLSARLNLTSLPAQQLLRQSLQDNRHSMHSPLTDELSIKESLCMVLLFL